jgi:hypothetical protein
MFKQKIIASLLVFVIIFSSITYLFINDESETVVDLSIQDLPSVKGSSGYPGIHNEYGLINSVDIYEDKLIYASNQGLFLHNISTNKQTRISQVNDDVIWAKIFGDNIIWYDRNINKIRNYNLENEIVINITNDDAKPYFPRIYGTYITWIDDRHDNNETDNITHSEIYLFDLETGIEKRLTYSFTEKRRSGFEIYKTKIGWDDRNKIQKEYRINILDFITNETEKIEHNHLLGISNKYILYTEIRELSLYDLQKEEEKVVVDKIKVLSQVGFYDNLLSFISPLNNLFIYDISSEKLITVVDQSNSPENVQYDIWSPIIWKNTLAWASKKDDKANIHVCTINEIEDENIFSFTILIGIYISISIIFIAILIKISRKK